MSSMRWVRASLTALLAALLANGSSVYGQDSAVSDKTTKEQAGKEIDHPAFLRIKKSMSGQPEALETAVATYESADGSKFPGVRVDLVGAVHIGSKEYYEELNRRFKDYDVVLYELVAEEGTRVTPEDASASRSPVSAMQVGMRDLLELDFQLQVIDYQAENFRHADMTPEEFMADMKERGDSLLQTMFRMIGAGMAMQASGKGNDAGVLMAMMAPDRTRQLRRALARQFQDMEVSTAGMATKDGKSTLITERNAKAMKVLLQELEAGKKKVAIFYGAGHLEDMGDRLVKDFGLKPNHETTTYIEAWDLR